MLGSPIGLVVKDLSPDNDAGRAALALAPRLLSRGFIPRLTAHRLAVAPPQDTLGPTLDMDTVGAWPFPAAWAAASFDRAARRRQGKLQVVLTHGFGDLSSQDVLTLLDGEPDLRKTPGWRAGLTRRQLAPDGSRVITVPSELMRGWVAERGVAGTRVRLVRPGVDGKEFSPALRGPGRFTLRQSAGWTDDLKIVFAPVWAEAERRHLTLVVRAVDRLLARWPVALCVVGKADFRGDAAAYRLISRGRLFQVERTPYLSRYLAAADAMTLPSRFEGFGIVVLESLACGTPAVVSDRVGAGEILTPGVDGEIVHDLNSPDELAAAIEKALGFDRAACRRKAEAHPWDGVADAHAKIYRELI